MSFVSVTKPFHNRVFRFVFGDVRFRFGGFWTMNWHSFESIGDFFHRFFGGIFHRSVVRQIIGGCGRRVRAEDDCVHVKVHVKDNIRYSCLFEMGMKSMSKKLWFVTSILIRWYLYTCSFSLFSSLFSLSSLLFYDDQWSKCPQVWLLVERQTQDAIFSLFFLSASSQRFSIDSVLIFSLKCLIRFRFSRSRLSFWTWSSFVSLLMDWFDPSCSILIHIDVRFVERSEDIEHFPTR